MTVMIKNSLGVKLLHVTRDSVDVHTDLTLTLIQRYNKNIN